MDPVTIGMIGLGGLGAITSARESKKADQLSQQALQQAQREDAERQPLRQLGMQALGQVERPMDLGQLGYDSANPYAAARGPAPSTASYGNWGEMTYNAAADPNRTERIVGQQRLDDTRQGVDGITMRIPDQLRQRVMGSLDREQHRLQGMQPMGSPFGFDRAPMANGTAQPAEPRFGITPLGGVR